MVTLGREAKGEVTVRCKLSPAISWTDVEGMSLMQDRVDCVLDAWSGWARCMLGGKGS